MCGIAGFAAAGRRSTLERRIAAMNEAQRHRGPDDGGFVVLDRGRAGSGSAVALGNRRLAIIDTSPGGHQPMSNDDGTVWVSFNGEIYNFAALREELTRAGFRFVSRSDTEVLVHGFEAWGIDGLLARISGMFAFAIWDGRADRMFIARDRLGEKPVYYSYHDGTLVFASEVHAVVASGLVECAVSPPAVYAYLSLGSVPAPLSIIEAVRALEPGCYLELAAGELNLHRYWDIRARAPRQIADGEAMDALNEMLLRSVRERIVSDVPLGIFLSGGIDSTAILALARRVSGGRIRAHSITFPGSPLDEARFSRAAARAFDAELTEYQVSGRDFAEELPRIISSIDQPSIDGINTYFVSKLTRASGTVVALSGIGGDELFGGYSSFLRVAALVRWAKALSGIPAGRTIAAALAGYSGRGDRGGRLRDFLRREPSTASAYLAVRGSLRDAEIADVLRPEFLQIARNGFGAIEYLDEIGPGAEADIGNAVSMLELRVYMHNQLLRDTDVMSMAHGLEVRCPLIDHELVELVLGLPPALKFAGHKALFLKAIGAPIPAEIVGRRKSGFIFPLESWLRSSWHERVRDLSVAGEDEIVNGAGMRALWNRFMRGTLHWSRIWSIIVLRLWLDEFRKRTRANRFAGADSAFEVRPAKVA